MNSNKRKQLEQYAQAKLHEMQSWQQQYRNSMLRFLQSQGISPSKENILQILHATSFSRLKNNPQAPPCPYYQKDKGCCKGLEINCLLCACPEYDNQFFQIQDNQLLLGRCKRQSRVGNYSIHPGLKNIQIWDCSSCPHPHLEETVKAYLITHMQELQQQTRNLG
jgi:hypothetical protein